jgi:hypothetical protein
MIHDTDDLCQLSPQRFVPLHTTSVAPPHSRATTIFFCILGFRFAPMPHTNTNTNSKQIYRQNNVCVIQRICYSAEKRNAKTKKNVNAYKRLEVVAYRGVGKKNKEIVTLTGYNADDVEMLAKKSVPGGINDQEYYRWRLKFYLCFSLELV